MRNFSYFCLHTLNNLMTVWRFSMMQRVLFLISWRADVVGRPRCLVQYSAHLSLVSTRPLVVDVMLLLLCQVSDTWSVLLVVDVTSISPVNVNVSATQPAASQQTHL